MTIKTDANPEVVILCGGRGTRLAPDTDVLPKPLVEVGGRPILWHIMAHYARFGFKRFVLCLGYKGELIRDYFLNYRLHRNDFTLHLGGDAPRVEVLLADAPDWEVTMADTGLEAQTGARVRREAPYLRAPYFLCTYGDGVCDVDLRDLVAFHLAHGRIATVTGVHPPARFGELVLGPDTRVDQFMEKPQPPRSDAQPQLNPRLGAGYVNGGFFVFDRAVLGHLSANDACVLEREPLERLAHEGQLRVYKHEGFWQCMDTPKDRETLDALLRTAAGLAPGGSHQAGAAGAPVPAAATYAPAGGDQDHALEPIPST